MLNTYFMEVIFTHKPGEWEDESEIIEIHERDLENAIAEAWEKGKFMVTKYGEGWEVADVQLDCMEEADYSDMDMYEYYGYEYGTDLWN